MKVIFFSFWLIPLFGLMSYQSSILLSIQKQSISIAATGLFPLFTTCFLAILILIFGHLDPFHAFICIGLSLFIVIVIQRVAISISLKTIALSPQEFSFEDKKVWRHVSLHLMINSIIYVGISSVDTFMLKILSNNKTVVAEFSVLLVLAGMYLLIQNASISTLCPLITPLIRNQQMNQLQIFLNKSLIFKFSLGLIVFLLFLIYGKNFLGILVNFTRAYTDI